MPSLPRASVIVGAVCTAAGAACFGYLVGVFIYGALAVALGVMDSFGGGLLAVSGAVAGAVAGFLAGVALSLHVHHRRSGGASRALAVVVRLLLIAAIGTLFAPAVFVMAHVV